MDVAPTITRIDWEQGVRANTLAARVHELLDQVQKLERVARAARTVMAERADGAVTECEQRLLDALAGYTAHVR